MWPPNSHAGYMTWEIMRERVYQKPVRDVDELKQRLIKIWSKEIVVDETVD